MQPHHRAHAGGGHGIGGLKLRKNIKWTVPRRSDWMQAQLCWVINFELVQHHWL